MAGDMFWQRGDTFISGQAANDGNTVYYGTTEWTGLVVNHVVAVNGGTSPPPVPTTTAAVITTAKVTSTSTAGGSETTSSSSSGGMAPHWAQCTGIGYSGPTACANPWKCVYSNRWYSQCL